MGWTFRRSRNLGPVRFTLSKRGLGWSLGNGFARLGVRADGRIARSLSLRGTGLSMRSATGGRQSSSSGLGCGVVGAIFVLGFLALLTIGALGGRSGLIAVLLVVLVGSLVIEVRKRRNGTPRVPDETASVPGVQLAPVVQTAPAVSPGTDLVWRDGYYERACPNPACNGKIRLTYHAVREGATTCESCRATVNLNVNTQSPAWHRLYEYDSDQKRIRILATYDEKTATAILRQEPFEGATQAIIREMFGEPENVVTEKLKKGMRVTWRYGQIGFSARYSTRIRFMSGLCDTWKVGD